MFTELFLTMCIIVCLSLWPVKEYRTKSTSGKRIQLYHTGKNKDILDFEIAYNKSFIYPITADRGSQQSPSNWRGRTQVPNGPR